MVELERALEGGDFFGSRGTGGAFAMGKERPRSLPRLATPTPQVSVVLYPEHSFPTSRHCEQYGRRRSHLTFLLEQVKQSSVAPPVGARLLRLRTPDVSLAGTSLTGTVVCWDNEAAVMVSVTTRNGVYGRAELQLIICWQLSKR